MGTLPSPTRPTAPQGDPSSSRVPLPSAPSRAAGGAGSAAGAASAWKQLPLLPPGCGTGPGMLRAGRAGRRGAGVRPGRVGLGGRRLEMLIIKLYGPERGGGRRGRRAAPGPPRAGSASCPGEGRCRGQEQPGGAEALPEV